jgi:osmotically-inducible protein OsmY
MNKRTDIQVHKDVLDELGFDPSIDMSQIAVAVSDGIVTLSGSVPNFYEKWSAERAVKRVVGVSGFAEELTVQPFPKTEQSDTDIAAAARHAIRWGVAVPEEHIKIKVEHGIITLEGQVDWHYQKQNIYTSVLYLRGVKGVTNLISLKPHLSNNDVREKIEAAFKRSADLDAGRIHVTADGGNVTLRGILPNWVEREAASRVAWNAGGVIAVNNEITVGY